MGYVKSVKPGNETKPEHETKIDTKGGKENKIKTDEETEKDAENVQYKVAEIMVDNCRNKTDE